MVDAVMAVMIWFTLESPFSVSTQLNEYLTGADSSVTHDIMNLLQIQLTGYNSFVQNEALKVMRSERQNRVIIQPQRQVRLEVIEQEQENFPTIQ